LPGVRLHSTIARVNYGLAAVIAVIDRLSAAH